MATLVSVGLLGLIVALWPAEPAAATPRTTHESALPDYDETGRDLVAPLPRERRRSIWM
jgi:hypothetical protein